MKIWAAAKLLETLRIVMIAPYKAILEDLPGDELSAGFSSKQIEREVINQTDPGIFSYCFCFFQLWCSFTLVREWVSWTGSSFSANSASCL